MSTYLLQDLIRVRTHREQEASEAVMRALRRLQEARSALAQAKKELEDYALWRVQEENRLLDGLMRRALKLGEINDVRTTISLLRDREFEFVDKVTQAEAAMTKAEGHLAECRRRHAEAVRDLEKLLEHRRLWQQERAQELEVAEDLELEDFARPRGGRVATRRKGARYERN